MQNQHDDPLQWNVQCQHVDSHQLNVQSQHVDSRQWNVHSQHVIPSAVPRVVCRENGSDWSALGSPSL